MRKLKEKERRRKIFEKALEELEKDGRVWICPDTQRVYLVNRENN